jgi:hypothetical protein
MRRFARNAALLLLILELSGRFLMAHQHFWYADAARRVAHEPARYIFIGSSRVAQAILPEAFSRAAGAPASAVLNLGRGYSTLAQHVMGLRLLAEASPGGLAGCIVLVEAPEGLPDLSTPDGRWFMEEDPLLVNAVMGLRDLYPFWQSTASVQDKVSVTMGEASSLAALRGSWRYFAREAWHTLNGRRSGAAGVGAPLTDAGGVNIDSSAYADARRLAEQMALEAVRDERIVTPREIDASTLMGLRAFLEHERAELVVYAMPVSGVQQPPYVTPVARRNRALVAEMLGRAGVRILYPDFIATDADFPDSWHLSAARAAAFSRALAAAMKAGALVRQP